MEDNTILQVEMWAFASGKDEFFSQGRREVPVELLMKQFTDEVHYRALQIDPDSNEDWQSITIGWAIAKGLNPADAVEFASYLRYHTDQG